jgi:hypothetical protein
VRRRPDEPTTFDGPEAPAEKPVAAPEAPERPTEQVRISRSRWTYLHNHVLACIKQAEQGHVEGAQRIESTAQTFMGLSQHDIIKWHVKQELEKCAPPAQALIAAPCARAALYLPACLPVVRTVEDPTGSHACHRHSRGCSPHSHFCRDALQGQQDIIAEIQLMQKVIQVMVAREGTLVEMQVPERAAGEGRQEFLVRREKERILIINPNYYME